MGTPASKPDHKVAAKRISGEYVAWLNSVKFENDEEEAATLREILSETSLRLQMAEED
jgi:hypothetical protein